MMTILKKKTVVFGCYRRPILFGLIPMVALSVASWASISFGAAIVGKTHWVDLAAKPTTTLDALKDAYRRPQFIPFPHDNPFTPEKVALGKKLYFDPRLSSTAAQSCASCHSPGFGWGDGLAVGVGHGMERLSRRSPTTVNAAWGAIFMWDGRATSLEAQALGPIQSPAEMNMPIAELVDRLDAIAAYEPLFKTAFPGQGISSETLAKAIASYERTIVSGAAPFDAWVEGDNEAISEEAKRGFLLFNTKGQCSSCHEGWNFTNDGFHDIGLASPDIGRGKFMPSVLKMQHAFKTPGLREIVNRAPYMHDGSLKTLGDVVDHYDQGGIDRPSRSDLIRQLHLTPTEKADLVAFLKTLSSDLSATTVPVLPR